MKSLLVFLSLAVPLTTAATSFEIEYADPDDIPYLCASHGPVRQFDSSIGGCWIPELHRMIIPPANFPLGGKYGCIYWHEYRHMLHGDWHKGPSSDCSWRPTQK